MRKELYLDTLQECKNEDEIKDVFDLMTKDEDLTSDNIAEILVTGHDLLDKFRN